MVDPSTAAAEGQRLLARRIRRLRRERGLSLQELSTRTGVSAQHFSYIERGMRLPSLTVLYYVAEALDLLVVELIDVYPYATRRPPPASDVPSDA